MKPSSFSPRLNAATNGACAPGEEMLRKPITGFTVCCARYERPGRRAADQKNKFAAFHGEPPKRDGIELVVFTSIRREGCGRSAYSLPEVVKLHRALASDFENNNHAIEGIDCRSRRAVRSEYCSVP